MDQSELSDHESGGEESYKDKEVLRRLYYDEGLSQKEIGERFGVGFQTISRHMVEHGINPGQESGQFSRVEYAQFLTDGHGYERWDSWNPEKEKKDYVKVHRLLAVAEYGFDAVCDKQVHHRNGMSWLNYAGNIEIVSRSEHMEKHTEINAEYPEEPYQDKRVLVALFYDRGLSYPEVADVLGCGRNTVKKWMGEHELRPCDLDEAVKEVGRE